MLMLRIGDNYIQNQSVIRVTGMLISSGAVLSQDCLTGSPTPLPRVPSVSNPWYTLCLASDQTQSVYRPATGATSAPAMALAGG